MQSQILYLTQICIPHQPVGPSIVVVFIPIGRERNTDQALNGFFFIYRNENKAVLGKGFEYVFTSFSVLSASLSSAVGDDQLAVMKSQDEILRTRKCAYRHSILNQAIRYIP